MGTVDTALLRRVAERAAGTKFVVETTVRPVEHPDAAVLSLDLTYYPDLVQSATLLVRTYTNGDFNVVYREDWGGGSEWRCRWDRHENPHNARDHFHQRPGDVWDASNQP